jgi:hypothetical protein
MQINLSYQTPLREKREYRGLVLLVCCLRFRKDLLLAGTHAGGAFVAKVNHPGEESHACQTSLPLYDTNLPTKIET